MSHNLIASIFLFMQVVRNYYGGRDIGPEDLTAALLVGVGPREHRRLMRKKSHWQNSRSSEAKEKQCNTTNAEMQEVGTPLDIPNAGDPDAEDVNNISANPGEDEMSPGGEEKYGDDDEGNYQQVNTIGTDGGDNTKGVSATSISNERSGLSSNNTHRSMHRESLLGHGPHGRQVVDMLIAKSGDDGIRHFCQIWRAVFVDALQPAYLPPGWDVSHRSASSSRLVELFHLVCSAYPALVCKFLHCYDWAATGLLTY